MALSALISASSSLVAPARCPPSTCDWITHRRTDSLPTPAWLLGDLGACRAAGEAALLGIEQPSPWDGVTYTWLGASPFWLGHEKEGQAALREAVERCRTVRFPAGMDRQPQPAESHPLSAGRP